MIWVRLALSIPLVFIVTAMTFIMMNMLPGNAAVQVLGIHGTDESIRKLEAEWGLDQPVYVQYGKWLGRLFRGDLGTSLATNESVVANLNKRIGVSLNLLFGALLVSVLVGVGLGVLTARNSGLMARLIDAIAILGFAVPAFWLALMLIYLFSVNLGVLPAIGFVRFSRSPVGWLRSLILPVVSLAIGMITNLTKQTRDAMLEELDRPYIASLRANGISERSIVYRHALRNAAIPVVTVISILFIGSLTGAVVAESIFVFPGLGSAIVRATTARDLPLIQGVALYLTLIVVVVNVVTDLAYGWLNPKVRKR